MSTNIDVQQIKQRFGIIGSSPLMEHAIRVAAQVAPTDMSVLVTGESGSGKEFFPQIIHYYSARKHHSYIAVNCGAIPEGTIDSELFGHRKGSFTGAVSDRKGYFEEASGGTIFLDEVGELPLPTQARLLRVLETGEFIPVGASQSQKTDVRIVAATNVNLKEAVANGKFREDLFFRLNTVPIEVPALRMRPDDVPLLFRRFAADSAEKYRMPPLRLSDEARTILMRYRWPGNVRELRNITDRLSILEEERTVSAETITRYLDAGGMQDFHPVVIRRNEPTEADKQIPHYEREIIYQVLYDMKKEIADLKGMMNRLAHHEQPSWSVGTDVWGGDDKRNGDAKWGVSTHTAPIAEAVDPVEPIQEASEYTEDPISLEEVERKMISRALERHGGKRKQTAEELKISERTLYRKIKEYGLE
ncbi:sigma-54-dependent Fis family transcriptional regulator [Porphyromonas gulae]|uniref:sigma-54 interaction domain-containing protein n=1 Tax=Porphyromonas gulae TaxID=111105 RepID=UPI0026EC67BA|nr:sigma-54 dependent transcriptional regulator [Porphyromonas gulae]